MLAGLFGKKSDYPLANLKSAQQVVDDVPKTDALKALQELTSWLESLREFEDEFRLEHQVAVVRLLDEAAQTHVRKLLRDYFSVQPLSSFQEHRVRTVLNAFYKLSEQTYVNILRRCRKGDKAAALLAPQLALLAARGVVAIASRLKLASVRYELIDPAIWMHFAEIYSFAEERKFVGESVSLYSGSGINTSVANEFAAAMVWYSVGSGSLSPVYIHIVERLASHLNHCLTVGVGAVDGCRWMFDLAMPSMPVRANNKPDMNSSVRLLGIGGVEDALNNMLKSLDKGILPPDINLGGATYKTELVRDAARQLLARCIFPPMRRNPRRLVQVNLHVANGFYKLIENTEVGLNFSNEGYEVWEIEDISVSGFRSVTSPAALNSIKIGSLIGSKPENMGSWGCGIVRRLSRDSQDKLHVGVEILANQLVGVTLDAGEPGAAEEDRLALYFNRQNDDSNEAWLLMKPGIFLSSNGLNMQVGDKTYLLLPLALVESGEDYDLARYRKMAQETGE